MSSAEFAPLPLDSPSRGRVDYSRLGVLRTKPGRVDSPPTACMSCSDKIALWTLCGIQGALGAAVLCPVRIDTIIIGDVSPEHRAAAAEDCQRAFVSRLDRERMGCARHSSFPPHAQSTWLTIAPQQRYPSRTSRASLASHSPTRILRSRALSPGHHPRRMNVSLPVAHASRRYTDSLGQLSAG